MVAEEQINIIIFLENNMPKTIISFQEDILTILNVTSGAFIKA